LVGSLFRRTKIICTLGPASASLRKTRAIIDAGADAIRLNFSHGDHAFHDEAIRTVRRVAKDRVKPIPVIQDLQGPRFRVGGLAEGYLELKRGMTVTLVSGMKVALAAPAAGRSKPRRGPAGPGHAAQVIIPVVPRYSFRGVKAGHRITLGDVGVTVRVTGIGRGRLTCKVTKGGTILSGKGIRFPQSKAALPTLTEKDLKDLDFGVARGVDFIALSFVRSAADVKTLRKAIGKRSIGIISKIETREAVRAIDEIIDESDAILVARGDLASEVSISRLPIVQKLLIEKCNKKAKPVITATQMLESMLVNPQPTRAEASDVANAVLDGSDALMLSGETAIGAFPVDAARTMASLIRMTERAHLDESIRRPRPLEPERQVDETIAFLAADAAGRLGAAAIITSTRSGLTALRVAKFRPEVPVLAVTPSSGTRMKLALSYGIICEQIKEAKSTDEMIRLAIEAARRREIVKKGDLVVITAGVPPWVSGKTNLLKLEVI
jgi:pyruvate kinase